MTFFGYPRGHRVKSETLVLEQHGGLTSPVDTRPRTKRLKRELCAVPSGAALLQRRVEGLFPADVVDGPEDLSLVDSGAT